MDQEQAEREVYATLHGMGWFSRANHGNLTDAGREIVVRLLGNNQSVLIERTRPIKEIDRVCKTTEGESRLLSGV